MPIAIQPYLKNYEQAVGDFNQRLQQSVEDRDLVFSETAVPRWLPPTLGANVWNEFFVAVEGGAVRGAYGLKQEQVFIREKGVHRLACYHHPLSEGIVDRSYATVGALLARDALARQPMLYTLGMGGFDRPIAKMLRVLGFTLTLVPFYFHVVHPNKFLREMQVLREARWRAVLMNAGALTGTGWAAIKATQAVLGMCGGPGDFTAEEVPEFSAWADDLWNQAKDTVSFAAVRDAKTLGRIYPATETHLTRIRVRRKGTVIGWAVVGERRKDAKFGEMRVGSVVDCWAMPENAAAVVLAARRTLEKRGVDLIVSNQSHYAWQHAFESTGFLKGPSNFVFAASRRLSELLQPFEENKTSFHITRADGDGLPRNF